MFEVVFFVMIIIDILFFRIIKKKESKVLIKFAGEGGERVLKLL